MSETLISLIIISFNTKHLLKEVLQNVEAMSKGLDLEIIVVDNASKDGSAEMVRQDFHHVVLIRSAENLGFAKGNNVGAKVAKGKYIVLLNSDAFLTENTLSIALKKMEDYPKAGLGGGKLMSIDGTLQASQRVFASLWNHFLLLSGNKSLN